MSRVTPDEHAAVRSSNQDAPKTFFGMKNMNAPTHLIFSIVIINWTTWRSKIPFYHRSPMGNLRLSMSSLHGNDAVDGEAFFEDPFT